MKALLGFEDGLFQVVVAFLCGEVRVDGARYGKVRDELSLCVVDVEVVFLPAVVLPCLHGVNILEQGESTLVCEQLLVIRCVGINGVDSYKFDFDFEEFKFDSHTFESPSLGLTVTSPA